jgi:hypothetical protein
VLPLRNLLFCVAGLVLLVPGLARAQACEGGLYLNPQVIRGEGTAQSDNAVRELIDFIRPSGLPVAPVLNIRETQDVLTAIKRPMPPCWVYGNPVTGLSSGYRPLTVNVDPIEAAVLVLGDVGQNKDPRPVDLESLGAPEQARILARLKASTCYGIKSGVTTGLVKATKLCGEVQEVLPQQGLGQSYLPTKAAFQWHADRWVGLITRLSSARSSSMKAQYGTDERVHLAQLVVVPVKQPSWGYGLYVHPGVSADAAKKVAAVFGNLKSPSPGLLRALDLGAKFEFSSLSDASVQAMAKALDITR